MKNFTEQTAKIKYFRLWLVNHIIILIVSLLLFFSAPLTLEAQDTEPQAPKNTVEIANEFLGLPFRADGAQDEKGQWVTWQSPNNILPSPGFNCSGFTLAAARRLLHKNFTLDEAKFDRLNDSGPQAPWGQDWDFGLDLILNLGQNHHGKIYPSPTIDCASRSLENGVPLGLGLNIHDKDFTLFLQKLPKEQIYFFAISKPDYKFKGKLSYYHVGLIVPSGPNELWFYHATKNGGVNRLNILSPKGLASLQKHFPPTKRGQRRIVLVGVKS